MICSPQYSDLIWVREVTLCVLQIFFHLPLRTNAVRDDALSHLVVQNGVTDAAVVETRLTAADEGTFDADVVFKRSLLQGEVLVVSIVTIRSDTSLGRGARAGLDGVNHSVVRRLLNEVGNYTIFTPIVMSA